MDRYTEKALEWLAGPIEWAASVVGERCESPIEAGLLKGFIAVHLCDRRLRLDGLPTSGLLETEWEARLFVQHEVGRFRVDFAINVTAQMGGKSHSQWIAVECDGHDFHERTKEQAARDKARDREIVTLRGFRILRFTGSEIHRDPVRCAQQVMTLAASIAEEWGAA